jgi:hypothetical protein
LESPAPSIPDPITAPAGRVLDTREIYIYRYDNYTNGTFGAEKVTLSLKAAVYVHQKQLIRDSHGLA